MRIISKKMSLDQTDNLLMRTNNLSHRKEVRISIRISEKIHR